MSRSEARILERLEEVIEDIVKEAEELVAVECDVDPEKVEYVPIGDVILLAKVLAEIDEDDDWGFIAAEENYVQTASGYLTPEELAVTVRAAELLAERYPELLRKLPEP